MIPFLGDILNTVEKGIADLFPNEVERNKALAILQDARNDIAKAQLNFESEIVASQASAVVAEEKGESPAQRNWRPHLMYLIMAILGFNFILVPIAKMFSHEIPDLPLPSELWTILEISLGGYVGGRSLEKITSKISENFGKK